MSLSVNNVHQAAANNTSLHSRESGSSVGQFRGTQVQTFKAESLESKITNAMEELPQHHTEKAESEKKTKDRKKISTALQQLELSKMIEEINQTLETHNEGQKPEQMIALLRKFKRQRNGNSDEFLKQTKEQFEKPNEQHAALVFIQKALTNELGEGANITKEIAVAKQKLLENKEDAHKVCSGYSVLTEATKQAQSQLSGTAAEAVAEFYNHFISGNSTITANHNALMKKLGGPSKYIAAHDDFIKNVGTYLENKGPLITKEELKDMTDSMYNIHFLNNSINGFNDLLNNVYKNFNEGPEMPLNN